MRIAEPMEAENYDTENPLDLITVLPKVSFDAPRCQDIAFPPQILVRWLSGRKRRFAKALYSLSGTEGSNPSLTASIYAAFH